MQILNSFSHEWLCTKTRFQKESKGNSEMAYSCVLTADAATCWTVNFHEDRIPLTLAIASICRAQGFVFAVILTIRSREGDVCNR